MSHVASLHSSSQPPKQPSSHDELSHLPVQLPPGQRSSHVASPWQSNVHAFVGSVASQASAHVSPTQSHWLPLHGSVGAPAAPPASAPAPEPPLPALPPRPAPDCPPLEGVPPAPPLDER